MKINQKLVLLTVAITLVSCNEKVSPELKDANSATATPTPTTTTVPTEYYFKIANKTPVILNNKLHKTGLGNASTPCEVRKTAKLSNAYFTAGFDDISCYFDTEELALYYGGLSLEIQASANTCEYVGYIPFSYFNRPAGTSNATLIQVKCMNESTNDSHVDDVPGFPAKEGATPLRCNEYVDSSFAAASRTSFTAETDDHLCRFNYKNGGMERCDEGVINVIEYQVTRTPANGTDPASTGVTFGQRTVTCGGRATNCIKGPINIDVPGGAPRTILYTQTVNNQEFKKTYSYEGKKSGSPINFIFSNYRRELADPSINFIDRFTPMDTYDPFYPLTFAGATNFQPNVMEYYAANRMLGDNSAKVLDWPTINAQRIVTAGGFDVYQAYPYSAEPYMGFDFSSNPNPVYSAYGNHRTNPFYTFYCLDGAYDIKARIRVAVREWDRVPSADLSKLELISDINEDDQARQDAPFAAEEIPYDPGAMNYFNDLEDWDDFLPMIRTNAPYMPGATVWEPKEGFFHTDNYPASTN